MAAGTTGAGFPASNLTVEGMHTLVARHEPTFGVIELDVPYTEKRGVVRHLHVVLPPRDVAYGEERDDVYPAVFFVQGSAFHEQLLGLQLADLANFARRGYVVVLIQYRGSEIAPFPAQAKDAKTAVRFVRDHAQRFHVDPDRMAMWGDSSGGHTTLMTWATATDQDFSDEPVGPDADGGLGLRAFVDWYGPADIGRMGEAPSVQDHNAADSPEGCLIGGVRVDEHPDLVAPTVIMNHVPAASDRALAPLLVMHGDSDPIVPFAQSVWLVEDASAKGQDVTFLRLAGAGHGGFAFWQPEVLDVVDEFLRRHLG